MIYINKDKTLELLNQNHVECYFQHDFDLIILLNLNGFTNIIKSSRHLDDTLIFVDCYSKEYYNPNKWIYKPKKYCYIGE